MHKVKLVNDVEMPVIMMGTSVDDKKGSRKKLIEKMSSSVEYAIQKGIVGFDTARDYGNEVALGNIFHKMMETGTISREQLFVTTKVGNTQQRIKNMSEQLEQSLNNLQLEYIDLWLLHWPLPEYYIDNWIQMCELYKLGKIRAIGIANCRERHLKELQDAKVDILPHVIQVEYHPFRNIPRMRTLCEEKNIRLEAYSANCLMLPFVKENSTLRELANKYEKTISQIIMRWHIQQGVVPIFSSMNQEHISSNVDVFDFTLTEQEMDSIFALNCDYKFHPESLNCPGY